MGLDHIGILLNRYERSTFDKIWVVSLLINDNKSTFHFCIHHNIKYNFIQLSYQGIIHIFTIILF